MVKKRDSQFDGRRVLPAALAVVLLTVLLRCGETSLLVLFDLISGLLVLVPVVLFGWWVIPWPRIATIPFRWKFLLASATGVGLVSTLVMVLGCIGLLHRWVWIAVLSTGILGGGLRLFKQLQRREPASRPNGGGRAAGFLWQWVWILPAVFLGLALVAASAAPGVLWSEEGYGYDVLEYHLQVPREYFEAGGIHYAPHNVYANFPSIVEMLYLLAMTVYGDAHDIGSTAQMIHLLQGVLAVYGVWVAASEWSPLAGHVAGVTAATTGWLSYLSGLAYVEHGLLFFGTTAVAAFLRGAKARSTGDPGAERHAGGSHESGGETRWLLVAGVMSGFACGCKYTGVAMFALPLAAAAAVLPGTTAFRARSMLVVLTGAALSVSPWLIKNVVTTGNPVFPLANTWFGATPPGWGDEQTAQWERGHAPSPRDLAARKESSGGVAGAAIGTLWHRTVADPEQRFGSALVVLGFGGLLFRKRLLDDALLMLLFLAQVAVWLMVTHWFARFAVVMIVPLALLAGRAVGETPSGVRSWLVTLVLVSGAVWNLAFTVRLHQRECPGPVPASAFYDGLVPGNEHYGFVNRELPADARVLLVGESRAFYFHRHVDYAVVFNRNPFAEAVASAKSDAEVVDWLQARGSTHVLVNWSEVHRLAGTYGFASEITPDLFDRLQRSGLRLVRSFTLPGRSDRYVDVYAVAP